MSSRFSDRAYNPWVVKQVFDSAQSLECDTLLQKNTRGRLEPQCHPFFVTTYSTQADWAIIESGSLLGKVFPEPTVICFRRANLPFS